jgi:hypothetical protein
VLAVSGDRGAVGIDNNFQLHTAYIQAVHTSPHALVGDGLIADMYDDVYPMETHKRKLCALSAKERKSMLTPEILAKRRGISVERAQQTIKATTHEGIRKFFFPSERKVWKKAPCIDYPSIKGSFYTYQVFSKSKSQHYFTVGSIYTNGMGYDWFFPCSRKSEHPDTVMLLSWSAPNFDLGQRS